MLIAEIYHKEVTTIHENEGVADALKELLDHRFNGLVVVDDKEKVTGVLALQDIAAATVPRQFHDNVHMAAAMYRKGFFSENAQRVKKMKVKDVMRKQFMIVDLDDNIMAVTAEFLKGDLYIVPVINEGELIGIVTRSQIKKALAYGMRIEGYY